MSRRPLSPRPWLKIPRAPQGLAAAGFVLGLMFGPNAGYPEGAEKPVTSEEQAKATAELKDVQSPSTASAAKPATEIAADSSAEISKKKAEREEESERDSQRKSLIEMVRGCEGLDEIEEARSKLGVHSSLFHEKDFESLNRTLEKAELAALQEALDSVESEDQLDEIVRSLGNFHEEGVCKRNKEILSSLYQRAANVAVEASPLSVDSESDSDYSSSQDADEIASRYARSEDILKKAATLPCLTSKNRRVFVDAALKKEAEECIAISAIPGDWKAARKARKCAARIEKRDAKIFRSELRSARCITNPYNPECQLISEGYARKKQSYAELARNAQQLQAQEYATKMAILRAGGNPQMIPQQPPQAPFAPQVPSAAYVGPQPFNSQLPAYATPSAAYFQPNPYAAPQMNSVFMGY